MPLRFGVDWTYEDYSGAEAVLESADILVLAHGAKGNQAMQANCDSFLALIDRFKSLTRIGRSRSRSGPSVRKSSVIQRARIKACSRTPARSERSPARPPR